MDVHDVWFLAAHKGPQSHWPQRRGGARQADARDSGSFKIADQVVLMGKHVGAGQRDDAGIMGAGRGDEQSFASAGPQTFDQPQHLDGMIIRHDERLANHRW